MERVDTDRNAEDALSEIIEFLYKPSTPSVLKRLVQVFQRAENSYFEQWDSSRILKEQKMPAPGELHLCYLLGSSPSPVACLDEPFLTMEGRAAYKKGLTECLNDLQGIENKFSDMGRIKRIKTCIINALTDINTISYIKQEKKVWNDTTFVT